MALADDIKRLARIPLLAQMEEDALRLIAFSAEARILRKGDIIFRTGDASDGGFVVIIGSVSLQVGDDEATARVAGPDALIGEVALIAPSVRPVTATAREPTTVLKISRALFHRVLDVHPEYAVRMREVLAQRLVRLMDDLLAAKSWGVTSNDGEPTEFTAPVR